MPRDLEPGVLYASMEYATAAHSCCCGCGRRIVTPLTPTDWKLTFNGESISLHPSIGNWQLPCRSHYVIREGRVIEAGQWSQADVVREMHRDQIAKRRHYGSAPGAQTEGPGEGTSTGAKGVVAVGSTQTSKKAVTVGFWSAMVRRPRDAADS